MAVGEISNDYKLGVARRGPVGTLLEATFDPALREAIEAYVPFALETRAVLIGTLAFNFYTRPRFATSAEFLVPRLPTVVQEGFAQSSPGKLVHRVTGAELRFVEPGTFGMRPTIADRIVATAVWHDRLPVASRDAMIALSLHGADDPRWRAQRLADVVAILAERDVDLTDWDLSDDHLDQLLRCRLCAR